MEIPARAQPFLRMGYLLARADEDTTETPGLHCGFKLAASDHELYLIDTDANLNAILDSIVFGMQATEISYGHLPNMGICG
jgi:hypothetical protein